MATKITTFSMTDQSITYFTEDLSVQTVAKGHPSFEEIRYLFASGAATYEAVNRLLDVKTAVENFGEGHIVIEGETVRLDGEVLHGSIVDTILEINAAGGDITPLVNFQVRLRENPSKQAVDELYDWIVTGGLTLLPDGRFLAYKKVRDDYSSFHPGPNGERVFNRPPEVNGGKGDVPSMPRNKVDDVRTNLCSQGLHFCSYSYLSMYYGGSGKVVVCAISPADVVSIPTDYNFAKGRAWTYEIIGETTEAAAKDRFNGTPVVNEDLTPYTKPKGEDRPFVDPHNTWFTRPSDGEIFSLIEVLTTLYEWDSSARAAEKLGVSERTLEEWISPYTSAKDALFDQWDEEDRPEEDDDEGFDPLLSRAIGSIVSRGSSYISADDAEGVLRAIWEGEDWDDLEDWL